LEGVFLPAAAIVVTYNSAGVIQACLKSLTEMAPSLSVIVVDNASGDDTLKELKPGARLIANDKNRGFASASNQGAQASDAEFLLLLNPDTRLLTPVDELIHASEQYGLASGKLVDKTGMAQKGFTIRRFPTPASLLFELFGVNRLWPSNPVNQRYRYLDRNPDQPGFVEQPAGAFLMVRHDVWNQLGGMDESFYPVWFEDVDFCQRAVQAGYQIQYVPAVVAEHVGGHAVLGIPRGCRAMHWCDSLLRYAAKHFRSFSYRAICLAVVLTSIPRAVAGMIQERSLSPITSCRKIVRFAGRRLLSSRTVPVELRRGT
jgi:N-acetylglucosaminyl-diphospho-decaprenol L-rhamnosyltransferase